MNAECHRCGDPAKRHRVTPKGRLYCLDLTQDGRFRYGRNTNESVLMRIPVKNLKRASAGFSNGAERWPDVIIGPEINKGLGEYL
jgi:hypothetical protein